VYVDGVRAENENEAATVGLDPSAGGGQGVRAEDKLVAWGSLPNEVSTKICYAVFG
jgi:hypothetical protein